MEIYVEDKKVNSENTFKVLWEQSSDGLSLTDENGIIVNCNNSFVEIVGKSKKELDGAPLSTMFAPDSSYQITNKYLENFTSNPSKSKIETTVILWNKKIIDFEFSHIISDDFQGNKCLLTVFTEVTERNANESLLREKDKLLLVISEAAKDLISALGYESAHFDSLEILSKPAEIERVYIKEYQNVRRQNPILNGKSVLIVDDNLANRKILSAQTELWGMKSVLAGDPKEAINIIKSGESFDLALIDYLLPGMNGLMLAKEIRSLYSEAFLPIILLTSVGKADYSAEVESLNISAFLNKPIKYNQLYDNILSILSDKAKSSNGRILKPSQIVNNLAEKYPLKILVAEDNVVKQKDVQSLLERNGYRADAVANGYEAVEVIGKIPYDIVFMDLLMPEMDGITASKLIKEERSDRNYPKIIAMISNAIKIDIDKCLAAGLDDFINKPIRMEELQSTLLHWGELIKNGFDDSTKSYSNQHVDSFVTESDILLIKEIETENDANFFCELLDAYLNELPTMIKQINTANENGDHKNLIFHAHKLKGSSIVLGIHPIAKVCKELESIAKRQSLNGRTKALSEELAKNFEQVIKELEVIKEKYSKFPL